MIRRVTRELLNLSLVAFGILSAGMGLKGFLLSSNFIDGGVTGICMLLAKTTGVSLSFGAGIGLAVRGGAVVGGTEIAARCDVKRTRPRAPGTDRHPGVRV